MQSVTIYTDGACSGNPGPGGYAAIIMYGDNKKEIFGAEENTTNNRMELRAAIEGMKALTKPCEVTLYSDSAYLVNAYNNNWVESWKKKGWKKAGNEAVKNVDLWEEIEALRSVHVVKFVKVKGHADNEFNNRCDELAVNAIKNISNGISTSNIVEKVDMNEGREDLIYKSFKYYPTLETERLTLRLFEDKDEQELYNICSNPDVTRFLSFDTYTSIDDAKKRIEFLKASYEALDEPVVWAIADKDTDKLMGSINYLHVKEKHKYAEIGYLLGKEHWNKGIMTEALKAVLEFGFETMGLNRIVIHCDERNIGSYRVMEKNGLVYEGTLREERIKNEEYINIKVYSMLRREYFNE